MFNFWAKGRASGTAVETNHIPEDERKALNDFTSIIQAIANLKGLDFNAVSSAVRKSTIEQRRAWLKDAKIGREIVRIRAKNDAEIAQALANLEKTDVATMTIMVNMATKEERRAWLDNEDITAEIARIRFENERDEVYCQAYEKLGKINEARAANLTKKHKREMDEERKRADASIEAEVARIRAEKAAKRSNDL